MFNMSTIGDYIKEERKKAGLTQEDFAIRSGLGLRFVRELEQGNCASGQSESGTGNVWERSCTRKKGGLAGGVRI